MGLFYILNGNNDEGSIKNPFVIPVDKLPEETIGEEKEYYLIYDYSKAVELFGNDVMFTSNEIKPNFYWVNDENDILKVIEQKANRNKKKWNVIKEEFNIDDCYYYEINEQFYILKNNQFYCGNKEVLDKIGIKLNISNAKTFDYIKPKLSHLGVIGENYTYERFVENIRKNELYFYFLEFIESIDLLVKNDESLEYYYNLLELENYLDDYNYVENINLELADKFDLEYSDLNFFYKHNGFNNKTGRIFQNSTNGNFMIQNLNNKFKNIIETDEDSLLVEIDFKAFEMFIIYQVLGIEFDFGKDPHLSTFERFFGYDIETDDKRSIGKKINFSILYGSNPRNLYYDIIPLLKTDLTLEEFVDRIEYLSIKGLNEFVGELKEEFREKGYITNYFKRKILAEKEYVLLNYYIQSTAADFFTKKCLKVIDIIGEHNRLLVQKFDSMLLLIKKYDIKDGLLNKIVLNLLSEEEKMKHRFEIKTGQKWGEMI